MKLRIFQSEKGDCLLLESRDGRLILCDGGMPGSMRKVVRGELAKLAGKGRELDFVYVSHIDQDHIGGVLQLLEDELEWRVYDHHQKTGNDQVRKPAAPRPPRIKGIWHNSFGATVGPNAHAASALLAAAAPALLATRVPSLTEIGEEIYGIATTIPEAIKVARLASPAMLNIPLNKLPGTARAAKLLKAGAKTRPFKVGSMRLTILGPAQPELTRLRKGWDNWVRDNAKTVREIDEELQRRMQRFSAAEGGPIDLGDWNGIPNHDGVTAPNIASLMFMVEEDGKRLLLTGDSQQEFILAGLDRAGFLDDGQLHLDVLKVQHHGSEHNLDPDFVGRVSADHYVFCGNGQHGNPDLSVIRHVWNSRLGPGKLRAKAPRADGRKFTLWFSTAGDGKGDAHMAEVKALVDDLGRHADGMMKAVFNRKDSVTLRI